MESIVSKRNKKIHPPKEMPTKTPNWMKWIFQSKNAREHGYLIGSGDNKECDLAYHNADQFKRWGLIVIAKHPDWLEHGFTLYMLTDAGKALVDKHRPQAQHLTK